MKILINVAVFASTVYLSAFVGLAVMQRSLLYRPHVGIVTPAEAGLPDFEALRLVASDGETLEAWFRPPVGDCPVFVYFHGNGGSLAGRGERFRMLTASGYGLLAVSYRGYGASTGAPTEPGLLRDAEAAYREARARGIPPARIVLVGESLGTAVATMIAARYPVGALVLDSPYDSMLRLASEHYPVFPVGLALLDTFKADEAIASVHVPVFMVAGENDAVTPVAAARRLYARANEPKTILEVPGAGHLLLGRPDVAARLFAWLDARLPAVGRADLSSPAPGSPGR